MGKDYVLVTVIHLLCLGRALHIKGSLMFIEQTIP